MRFRGLCNLVFLIAIIGAIACPGHPAHGQANKPERYVNMRCDRAHGHNLDTGMNIEGIRCEAKNFGSCKPKWTAWLADDRNKPPFVGKQPGFFFPVADEEWRVVQLRVEDAVQTHYLHQKVRLYNGEIERRAYDKEADEK